LREEVRRKKPEVRSQKSESEKGREEGTREEGGTGSALIPPHAPRLTPHDIFKTR
jgi:hypothetical protein